MNHEYFNRKGFFDFDALSFVVQKMVFYLDRTGTVNQFPTQKHKAWYEQNRPIGIGIMGLADVLLRYGIKYGSERSVAWVQYIMKEIQATSYKASEKLGKELGIPEQCKKLDKPRRNITTVSVAPTGSIAMLAECSHGIEPIFSPSYLRIDERGEEYLYTHPLASKNYFVSAVGAKQASWREQIDLVASAQKYCDSGISKTINLPYTATVQDVKDAILYAWKMRCKGITLYRDGSRQYQVLNQVSKTQPKEADLIDINCKSGVCSI